MDDHQSRYITKLRGKKRHLIKHQNSCAITRLQLFHAMTQKPWIQDNDDRASEWLKWSF
jgi:hypothetical protein